MGGRACSDPHRRAAVAPARLAGVAERWLYLSAMGAAGYTAFVALFYVAAHRTSALNLSIIQGAIPALVLFGARIILGLRFTALQALGALITMLGVMVIAAQGKLQPSAGARLQQRRRHDGDRGRALRRVHDRRFGSGRSVSGLSLLAGMAVAAFITSVPLMIWEVFLAASSGQPHGACSPSPMWRLAPRSPRKYFTCAGLN